MASDLASLVPQTVSVAFRATGVGQPANGFYNVDTNLFDIGLVAFKNTVGYPWTRLLHRYELATYGASPPPTNESNLNALALQMTTDWYQWQLGTLDRYFAGIAEWNPEGLHDITFSQRDGKITTHVQRMVFNPAEDLLYETNQLTNNTPVVGIGDNSILYIDNGFISGDSTHLSWDESTFLFSVVGGAYFDIKNNKTFIIEETTTNNQYFKITNSTNQINIWENTLIVNEGLVKIDISIVNQQFFVWDQTNYYIKIDDSTQLITFWNAFITIASNYFKITYSGSDYFYADNSDQSIKIGWPTKTTSDTSKYSYWHYVAGKPTGAVPSKTGYWAWLWDSTNYRSWFYAQSVSKWLLECCWIIVKKSSNYTAEYGDFIWGDTSGGGVDIDLPSPLLNQEIKIKTDTLTNPLRVTGTGIGTNVPLTLQNLTYDFYSDGTNWYTDDIPTSTGGSVKVTVLTSGTAATFTKDSTKTYVKITVVGGGGGGGGCAGGGAGGGGGGGCAIWEGPSSDLNTTETYTVGAGGAGGSAGNNDGSDGSNSTFTVNAVGTLTGNGGIGGSGTNDATFPVIIAPSGGGSASSGLINISGNPSGYGMMIDASIMISGSGGASHLSPSVSGQFEAAGQAGAAYGGGGSGGASSTSTNRAGGAGASGVIIVEEFS